MGSYCDGDSILGKVEEGNGYYFWFGGEEDEGIEVWKWEGRVGLGDTLFALDVDGVGVGMD